jgi:hypothetical protein
LGDDAAHVVERLGAPRERRPGKRPANAQILDYESFLVFLTADVVTAVMALSTYSGLTPRGVHTGMSWQALTALLSGVSYDETRGTWRTSAADEGCFEYEIVRPARSDERSPDGWIEEQEDVFFPSLAVVHSIMIRSD